MSHFRDDGPGHSALDLRLQARALALALEPKLAADRAADALVAMAGATPAAPIAARRALVRLETAHSHRPDERTGRAIKALRIALARVQARMNPQRSRSDQDMGIPE